jgi:hypothetical protein
LYDDDDDDDCNDSCGACALPPLLTRSNNDADDSDENETLPKTAVMPENVKKATATTCTCTLRTNFVMFESTGMIFDFFWLQYETVVPVLIRERQNRHNITFKRYNKIFFSIRTPRDYLFRPTI